MRITYNTKQNFGELYAKGDAFMKLAELSKSKKEAARVNSAYQELKSASENTDVLLTLEGKQTVIKQINPETMETKREISRSNDFIQALETAALRIKFEVQQGKMSKNSGAINPAVVDANKLNQKI